MRFFKELYRGYRESRDYKKTHVEYSVELLGLMDWVSGVESIHITKTKGNYAITVFDYDPECRVVANTGYHKAVVPALVEAKIRHDGYLATKQKLEELKSEA